jgi:hypothetical protein
MIAGMTADKVVDSTIIGENLSNSAPNDRRNCSA